MNEFVTWELLGTFAGAVAATAILTQGIKQFVGISPRWISWLIAAILCLGYTAIYLHDLSPSALFLTAINSLIVAMSASGAYEYVIGPLVNKDGDSHA